MGRDNISTVLNLGSTALICADDVEVDGRYRALEVLEETED